MKVDGFIILLLFVLNLLQMNLCGVCVVFVEALAMQNYKSLFKIFACSKFLNKEEFLNKHAAKIHKINELHKKSYNFYFKTSSMDDAFLLSLIRYIVPRPLLSIGTSALDGWGGRGISGARTSPSMRAQGGIP